MRIHSPVLRQLGAVHASTGSVRRQHDVHLARERSRRVGFFFDSNPNDANERCFSGNAFLETGRDDVLGERQVREPLPGVLFYGNNSDSSKREFYKNSQQKPTDNGYYGY
jgi:hypothetical protein